jgi:DNA-binding response OmpR family regulator
MNEESKNILVVDNSREVRIQLLELLTRYGYTVLESGSPTEALETLQKYDVELLIAEVGTPGVVEETLIQEVRSNVTLADLPVIVLATAKEVGDVATWVKRGCNDFLLKPVNPRILFQRVQALIEANPRAYSRVPCNVLAEGTTGSEQVTGELEEHQGEDKGFCSGQVARGRLKPLCAPVTQTR